MDPLHVRHMDIYAYLLMREKKTVELQRLVCHHLVSITFDLKGQQPNDKYISSKRA